MWNYLKVGYALPFRVFAFFMGHYIRNRNRLKVFMARPRVRATFAGAIVLTVLVWIGIGVFASDADRGRLTEAVKALWADTQALNAEKKRLNQAPGQQQGEAAQ